jgi:hypothetical protein
MINRLPFRNSSYEASAKTIEIIGFILGVEVVS